MREDQADFALALVLTAVAGYVDAIGFLKLGHLFVSFMSGNTTQFAMFAAQTNWAKAAGAGAIVGLFVLGVMAGRILRHVAGKWGQPAILILVSALLAAAIAVPGCRVTTFVPLVLAMGMQNEAIHRAGQVRTRLTYVTGTLIKLGESFVDAFFRPGFSWSWLFYLVEWLSLLAGASVGTLAYIVGGDQALLFPAVAAFGTAIWTALPRSSIG